MESLGDVVKPKGDSPRVQNDKKAETMDMGSLEDVKTKSDLLRVQNDKKAETMNMGSLRDVLETKGDSPRVQNDKKTETMDMGSLGDVESKVESLRVQKDKKFENMDIRSLGDVVESKGVSHRVQNDKKSDAMDMGSLGDVEKKGDLPRVQKDKNAETMDMGILGDVVESKGDLPRVQEDKKAETMDIKLMSNEGKIFCVTEEVARQCETVEHLINDGCADNIIPLSNVTTQTLEVVLEWCKKHTYSVMKDMYRDELKEWENNFFHVDLDTLYHLFYAANYLHHGILLDRCAEKVASFIENKSPDEIREFFGIKNDFTPEEYDNIIASNAWAFE